MLLGNKPPLALDSDGGDEPLDLGGLGGALLAFLLGGDLTANGDLADVVLLGEVEELAELVGPLGTKAHGLDGVGESWNFLLALLDNNEGEDREILGNNAAADGLATALTSAALAEARVALGEQEADPAGGENTLLHGEALLVIATADPGNVALPLVTEDVKGYLVGETLVPEDGAKEA